MMVTTHGGTGQPDGEREHPLIGTALVNNHRRMLRRYLWSRRESVRQVPELVARGANNAEELVESLP